MSWKDIVKNHQEMLYYSVIFGILILAAVITWNFFSQSGFDELLKNYSQYKIAIIAASASSLGIMIYIGNIFAMKIKYHFIEVSLDFKNYTIVIGSLFLIVITAVYFTIKHNDALLNVLYYLVEMGTLAFFLGSATFFNPYDNKRVTLKMFTCTESGGKKLETITDLELYQRTSTDYRFKYSNNGKNFIVPIGQIQAIESQELFNAKEQPEEKVMEFGNKRKTKKKLEGLLKTNSEMI